LNFSRGTLRLPILEGPDSDVNASLNEAARAGLRAIRIGAG
jgi:hypothetical protein